MSQLVLTIVCSPQQIVSRGRLVCRCYRRVNASEAFGRPAGELACVGCQSTRTAEGGMSYRVTLCDVADLAHARATNGESADFSPLTEEWTPETALPPDPMPQLGWSPQE